MGETNSDAESEECTVTLSKGHFYTMLMLARVNAEENRGEAPWKVRFVDEMTDELNRQLGKYDNISAAAEGIVTTIETYVSESDREDSPESEKDERAEE